MARYKTKPTIVDAVQFNPHVKPWPSGIISWKEANYQPRDMSWGCIQTDFGRLHVCGGDWIITNVNGERSICKPDIFKWLYEECRDDREAITSEHRGNAQARSNPSQE